MDLKKLTNGTVNTAGSVKNVDALCHPLGGFFFLGLSTLAVIAKWNFPQSFDDFVCVCVFFPNVGVCLGHALERKNLF